MSRDLVRNVRGQVMLVVFLVLGLPQMLRAQSTTVRAGTMIGQNFSNGTLTIEGGTARVLEKATANDPSGTTVIPSLIIAGLPGAPLGALDLTNNSLVVNDSSTMPSVSNWLAAGFAGGTWAQTGITSSTAARVAADPTDLHKTGLGIAQAGQLNISTFAGQQVDSTAVLVSYTLLGDTNLDGEVNMLDVHALATHFGSTSGNWVDGDSNYDGIINTLDFSALASNFGTTIVGAPGATAAISGQSPLPEPSMIVAALASTMISLTARRRRTSSPVMRRRSATDSTSRPEAA